MGALRAIEYCFRDICLSLFKNVAALILEERFPKYFNDHLLNSFY